MNENHDALRIQLARDWTKARELNAALVLALSDLLPFAQHSTLAAMNKRMDDGGAAITKSEALDNACAALLLAKGKS